MATWSHLGLKMLSIFGRSLFRSVRSVLFLCWHSESQRASAPGQESRFVGGKWPLSTFWAPMRNVSPCRLQHVQINLHPFYMEPLRNCCYFLQTEQNSTLLSCLLSLAAERICFERRRQAGRKPRSLSSCSGLLWQWRLPADKWSISPNVQVLRAYRCPGHINQFPAGSFVLGFALTVDILGPVMPDAFFWNLKSEIIFRN